jgi:hypothetical protein
VHPLGLPRAAGDRGVVRFDFDSNQPGDPISISREEFDEIVRAARQERRAGAPGPATCAYGDFRGWRVNYDGVLIALAGFVMAPYGPWTSDETKSVTPLVRRSPVRRQAQRVLEVGRRSTTT